MKRCILLLIIVYSISLQAQLNISSPVGTAGGRKFPEGKSIKCWIYFTDKSNSPYSKNNPGAYLSQRSVDRRKRFNISVDENDLPVNPDYTEQLRSAGINIIVSSRWLNAVSANINAEQLQYLATLPFIKQVTPVRKYTIVDDDAVPYNAGVFYKNAGEEDMESMYGVAETQITQINLDTILEMGLKGDSMLIAVIDAGFYGADTATLFQSFWDKGQIIGYHNFPDNNDQVFNIASGIHGSWVMSVIGGDIADTYSGSAPNAKFYLFRTEIGDSEHVVEEDYWQAAAERADSVGADIINSSLGYTVFDDGVGDHTYADLDGNTTVVTNAADMAAQKGILVCNSAGNEGADWWHYISMPSDGDSVFCIGGVDASGNHAYFSGFGPTSDGRLKPNVVAMGQGSAVLDPYGDVAWLDGTSFSSPLMAGACASLWQAFPTRNNMDIIDAVQRSANLYLTPNDSMGYGIPDFGLAYEILLSETPPPPDSVSFITILPQYAHEFLSIEVISAITGPATMNIYSLNGELLFNKNIFLSQNVELIPVTAQNNFAGGIYIVSITTSSMKKSEKIFIW